MRTRLRTLRIGAREFRWTAQLCGFTDPGQDYHRCVRVRVWGGGKNGRALRADLGSVNQGPWAGVPDSSYPTPGAVRAIIDYALHRGWDPAAAGGHHDLQAGAGLEIPGFHVTDPRHSLAAGGRPASKENLLPRLNPDFRAVVNHFVYSMMNGLLGYPLLESIDYRSVLMEEGSAAEQATAIFCNVLELDINGSPVNANEVWALT
jgi:hypothetical protein